MDMLTIKTTAKRSPAWHFVVGGLVAFAGFAFDGWLACQLFGWPTSLAREAVVVCSVVCVAFMPFLYRAYDIRFRKRNPNVVPRTAAVFMSALCFVALYYLDKGGVLGRDAAVRWFTIIVSIVSLGVGTGLMLFAVKYELE
jgi:hypothetical protein